MSILETVEQSCIGGEVASIESLNLDNKKDEKEEILEIITGQIKCPECGSTRIIKDGFRNAPLNALSHELIQRYRCKDYQHRFSEHLNLKTTLTYKQDSQISANLGAKNMVPTQEIKPVRRWRNH